MRIYYYAGIQSRLPQHRCAELDSSTIDLFQNVHWFMCDKLQDVELDSGDPNSILKIRVQFSQHHKLCEDFVPFENDKSILSFSGDSGFNGFFYNFLWTAPTVLVDGRQISAYEHASFDEIVNFYKTTDVQRTVFVYHYGLENEKPIFTANTVLAISPGQRMQLMLPQSIPLLN